MSVRDAGKQAYRLGLSLSDAPYCRLTSAWWLWVEGYLWAAAHYPISGAIVGCEGGCHGAG